MTKPASFKKRSASNTRPNSVRKPLNWLNAFGVAAVARELSLYESQLYNWRSKQQQQLSSSDREMNSPLKMPISNASWLNEMKNWPFSKRPRHTLRSA